MTSAEPPATVETALEVSVIVEDPAWAALGDPTALQALVERAVAAALAGPGHQDLKPLREAAPFGVAVMLTSDEAVARLNEAFRGKAAPTNVLSWPAVALDAPQDLPGVLAEIEASAAAGGDASERHLGDIAMAYGVTAREAASRAERTTLEDHATHLIVHGVLHLLGYDHIREDDAARMEARERAILARLGVADPYGDGGSEREPGVSG